MNVYLPFTARLPSAYQEVEYIQSSGTQYIKIGTSFKTSYKTVIDFQMTVTGGDYVPIGVRTVYGGNKRYGIDAWSSYFKVIAGGGDWNNTIAEDTNRHTITLDKSTAIVDGTSYSVQYVDWTFNDGIGVFYYHKIGETPYVDAISSNKLYKLDIYDENGTHIYNLVPCYRKSDNVIGLYDLVNNQFYTNSGTGTFSKGNDVTMTEMKNAYIGEVWTPGSNTIAYYPLTATSTVNDISGNNRNLTNSNVSFGTFAGKNCASFNGSSRLYGGSSYTSGNPATISIWVYCTGSSTTTDPIYYGGLGFWISYYDNYEIRYSPGSTNTNKYLSLNKWKHLVLTISSDGTVTAYYNGIKIATVSGNTASSGITNIGSSAAPSDYWRGYLSEAIIESKVRTDTEVLNYYNNTKSNYGL